MESFEAFRTLVMSRRITLIFFGKEGGGILY